MQYRQQQSPGCGGCLLIAALLIFITGGGPALMKFVGSILYTGFFFVFLSIAGFWFFTWWVQRKVVDYERSQSESHNRFVWLLVNILIDFAKIDGEITRAEIQTIQNFFQINLRYNQTQMNWVKELIKEATTTREPIDPLLREFRQNFPYEHRFILLELIYQLLSTKTDIPESELEVARRIARILEISAYDQQTLESKYRYHQRHGSYRRGGNGAGAGGFAAGSGNEADRHFATLGLTKGASAAEIKKAYRSLSMQYHPDKVQNLGKEFQKMAEEKMKEINVAHDYFERNGYI